MMSWWEAEKSAEFRMQDRMREAARERLARRARGTVPSHTGLLSRVAAWLNGRFLSPTRRRQERCCATSASCQAQSGPCGSPIR